MLSARALAASPHFDLVAIADTSPAARDRLSDVDGMTDVVRFPSYQAMFAAVPAQVVCVSTYAPTHLEIATAALAAGAAGLLVEKPLGSSTAEGAAILERAEAQGVPVVVPHGLMAGAAPLEVIAQVAAGAIGQLRVAEMECTGWDIINAGVHWIQYFITLVSPAVPSRALCACDTSTRTYRDGTQVETEAILLVTCDNGARLLLHTGDSVPMARDDVPCLMRLVGDEGYLEYGAWRDDYRLVSPKSGDRVLEVPPAPVSGHRRHLERLAELVATGTVDYEIPRSSLRALEVVEAAYLSNRTGAAVSLPLAPGARETDDSAKVRQPAWDPGAPYLGAGGGRDGRQL
jgi:predicted dehydrogenase